MSDESEVASRFAEDTKDHVMTVELDQGVHRCLYFGKPGTSSYSFRIVTWPGHLGYSGDMGDFMFCRLEDMFKFFRGERINPSYWAEKCVAVSRDGGVEEFSADAFLAAVRSEIEARWDRVEDAPPELVEDVMREAEQHAHDSRESAITWAVNYAFDWEHNGDSGTFTMQDFWEHDCTAYTHRFLWCLHALVWGIGKYDESKAAAQTAKQDAPSAP